MQQLQYQIQSVGPPELPDKTISQFESRWHYPWSEPVRQKIAPALAVALIASGLFAPVLTTSQIEISQPTWLYPWSEPTRLPLAKSHQYQKFQAEPALPPTASFTKIASRWLYPWSEPVRVSIDKREAVALAASGLIAPVLNPSKQITQFFESRWHYPWTEPVKLPQGLRAWLQTVLAWPSDIVPPPIIATLSAHEINTDVALFGIDVYSQTRPPYVLIATTNVTVSEIPAINAGATSIVET